MPSTRASARTITGPAGQPIEYELSEPRGAPAGHVVFVMGLGNHRTMWEAQQAHFAASHALLFVDNRGIGSSGSVSGLWTMQGHAEDVLHVLGLGMHEMPTCSLAHIELDIDDWVLATGSVEARLIDLWLVKSLPDS